MSDQFLSVLVEGFDPEKALEMEQHQQDDNSEDWREIYAARQNNTILQAELTGIQPVGNKTIGTIFIGNIKGMIPLELSGTENIRQFRKLVGKKIAFKIIALDRFNKLFTASRKAALEHMASATWKRLEKNMTCIAVVQEVRPKRVRLDLGGIQVNMAADEYDYAFIEDLNDHLKYGDHMQVKITEVDKENQKIKVSAKALKNDLWSEVATKFQVQGEYTAKCTGITEYGIYFNLQGNVDCLTVHPKGALKFQKGDKALVRITKIETDKQHINAKILRKL